MNTPHSEAFRDRLMDRALRLTLVKLHTSFHGFETRKLFLLLILLRSSLFLHSASSCSAVKPPSTTTAISSFSILLLHRPVLTPSFLLLPAEASALLQPPRIRNPASSSLFQAPPPSSSVRHLFSSRIRDGSSPSSLDRRVPRDCSSVSASLLRRQSPQPSPLPWQSQSTTETPLLLQPFLLRALLRLRRVLSSFHQRRRPEEPPESIAGILEDKP